MRASGLPGTGCTGCRLRSRTAALWWRRYSTLQQRRKDTWTRVVKSPWICGGGIKRTLDEWNDRIKVTLQKINVCWMVNKLKKPTADAAGYIYVVDPWIGGKRVRRMLLLQKTRWDTFTWWIHASAVKGSGECSYTHDMRRLDGKHIKHKVCPQLLNTIFLFGNYHLVN